MLVANGRDGDGVIRYTNVEMGDTVLFTNADGSVVPAIVTRTLPPNRVALTVLAPETSPRALGDRPFSITPMAGHWSFRP